MPEQPDSRTHVRFIQFTGRMSYGEMVDSDVLHLVGSPRSGRTSGAMTVEALHRLGVSAPPATCHGCQHYEGGANGFVCGMYPSGPENEECADFAVSD